MQPALPHKPQHRITRIWTWSSRLARVSLLAAIILWAGTLIVGLTIALPGGIDLALYGGSFNLGWREVPLHTPGIYTYPNSVGAVWLLPSVTWFMPTAPPPPGREIGAILPMWIFAIASAAIALIAARKCRPSLEGLCKACRYDLTATPSARRCPECGRGVRPA